MDSKTNIKKLLKVVGLYGPQVWLILFFSNIAVIGVIRIFAANQSCLTIDQVNNDSRCLYILNNDIYQMGSKSNPHRGHPCGMDVTSIIPGNHKNNSTRYLTPNYVGSICSVVPTQAPTNPPTQAPTSAPTNPPTQVPTQAPTAQSQTLTQTKTPTTTPTLKAGTTPTPVNPTATSQSTKTATPTPTGTSVAPQITAKPTTTAESVSGIGFGGLLGKKASKSNADLNSSSSSEPSPDTVDTTTYFLIKGSTIVSYISLSFLIIVFVSWLILNVVRKGKNDN